MFTPSHAKNSSFHYLKNLFPTVLDGEHVIFKYCEARQKDHELKTNQVYTLNLRPDWTI